MSTFFWPKFAKKCQKSQKTIFLISTVWKLLSEVEPWSVKLMWPKSATRFGTKLPKCQKSATRCGKMSPKGFQGVSKDSKGFQGKVVPDVAKKRQRGSKGKCYQMWQKVAKGVPKVVQGRPTIIYSLWCQKHKRRKKFLENMAGNLKKNQFCIDNNLTWQIHLKALLSYRSLQSMKFLLAYF